MKSQGRYRIHAVAELTGVPEATLRAWERRYSVPTPVRTASGYRLYSMDDVECVRRMRDLCAKGIAPVDASKMVREPYASPSVEEPAHESPFEAATARLIDAARRMRPEQLEHEVQRSLMLGDASSVVEQVFSTALVQIGNDWENGLIGVAQEHLASEVIFTSMRQLVRLAGPSRPVGEVVLACFADEEHVLPLYMAAFRFVEWRYRPHILGARTPPEAIATAIHRLQPSLVGLSSTMLPDTERATELIHDYAAAVAGVPWIVGGSAAQLLRKELEGAGAVVASADREASRQQIGLLLDVPTN
ncbi:MAG: MerR family transcriptional regulator [Myxococcales bacterium]